MPSTQTDEPKHRLAQAIISRRRQLELTRAELRARGGPGQATLGRLENARAGDALPRPRTLRKLDRALDWEPGSCDAILAGDQPHESTPNAKASKGDQNPTPAATFLVDTELLDRLMSAARTSVPAMIDPTAGKPYPDTAPLLSALYQLSSAYAAEILGRTHIHDGMVDAIILARTGDLRSHVSHAGC